MKVKYKVGNVVLMRRREKEYLVVLLKIGKKHCIGRILKTGQVWDFETKEIYGFPK